jgi:hypothetical protein
VEPAARETVAHRAARPARVEWVEGAVLATEGEALVEEGPEAEVRAQAVVEPATPETVEGAAVDRHPMAG